jgi:hypothetical protein
MVAAAKWQKWWGFRVMGSSDQVESGAAAIAMEIVRALWDATLPQCCRWECWRVLHPRGRVARGVSYPHRFWRSAGARYRTNILHVDVMYLHADASLDQTIDEKLLVRADDDVAPDTELSGEVPG